MLSSARRIASLVLAVTGAGIALASGATGHDWGSAAGVVVLFVGWGVGWKR